MSHNFELLTEIESELGISKFRESRAPNVSEQLDVDRGDAVGTKLTQLVQRIFPAYKHVVFCGVEDEDATSAVCANTARALASIATGPICLVDADLRGKRLVRRFRSAMTLPASQESLLPSAHCVQVEKNLWICPSAFLAGDHGRLKAGNELGRSLGELRSVFQHVLIHARGARMSDDALRLGKAVDAVLLVIEAGKTKRHEALKSILAFERADVRLAGTVFTGDAL